MSVRLRLWLVALADFLVETANSGLDVRHGHQLEERLLWRVRHSKAQWWNSVDLLIAVSECVCLGFTLARDAEVGDASAVDADRERCCARCRLGANERGEICCCRMKRAG